MHEKGTNRRVTKTASAYRVSIFIGGEPDDIASACAAYCAKGLCVTIKPLTYVYTGGSCEGAEIGLINYARFPREHGEIWQEAEHLANFLLLWLGQGSYTVQDDKQSLFVSYRDEDQ